MGLSHWKNRWIQTPQWILMDPCIKQAPVLSKRFWIIPWPLAYSRLELDCIRKIINFWYTFGWKWRVFVTIWDCRTRVRMTSMTSSVERTDLDFKISVALMERYCCNVVCGAPMTSEVKGLRDDKIKALIESKGSKIYFCNRFIIYWLNIYLKVLLYYLRSNSLLNT